MMYARDEPLLQMEAKLRYDGDQELYKEGSIETSGHDRESRIMKVAIPSWNKYHEELPCP